MPSVHSTSDGTTVIHGVQCVVVQSGGVDVDDNGAVIKNSATNQGVFVVQETSPSYASGNVLTVQVRAAIVSCTTTKDGIPHKRLFEAQE